jgi:acyl-CoA dehydrogenase
MKLVALRAADYMRSASAEDRRYLLYNPVVKMNVTTQGE